MTRGQRMTAAIVLAFNLAAAPLFVYVLAGMPGFWIFVFLGAETLIIGSQLHRLRNSPYPLTPLPKREGPSRSGARRLEAFFRVREEVASRFSNKEQHC